MTLNKLLIALMCLELYGPFKEEDQDKFKFKERVHACLLSYILIAEEIVI